MPRTLLSTKSTGPFGKHELGEAGDGLEAVQKAQELKPDLILLDIGLPSLNGIEVAKRIRQVAPNAGIIFLTLNSDKEMVRAALNTGHKVTS